MEDDPVSAKDRKVEKWGQIVKHLNIDLSRPISRVSARNIKEITGEEPRLMAKINKYSSLPKVFRDNGVFLLPITNKSYVIVKGKGYQTIEAIKDHPLKYETTMPELITLEYGLSEAQHLSYAYNSGLLGQFLGIGNIFPTIQGRKYSPSFKFRVDGTPYIEAKSVQVEVDAGYEATDDVAIIEAKIAPQGDFLIKQLYYPYRFWRTFLKQKKRNKIIHPVFFIYDPKERSYNLFEYSFEDPFDYESISLKRAKKFRLQFKSLPKSEFTEVELDPDKKKYKIVPQADKIDKILELPFLVTQGIDNSSKVANYFKFEKRQSSYYREATESLGLIELYKRKYILTDLGKEYISLSVPERNLLLCKLILSLPFINKILIKLLMSKNKSISRDEISKMIKEKGYSGTTPYRRSQTIFSWFKWMQEQFGIFEVGKDSISLNKKQKNINDFAG